MSEENTNRQGINSEELDRLSKALSDRPLDPVNLTKVELYYIIDCMVLTQTTIASTIATLLSYDDKSKLLQEIQSSIALVHKSAEKLGQFAEILNGRLGANDVK